ncbi:MAG: response regulator [Sphingomonadaceae bacterium]|nr:response regulator [Sphingomonadaceae bacterium]
MLFARRRPSLRRLLIVEDEPLVAFDNEHLLGESGYEVVATVDRYDDAVAAIQRGGIDLVLADVRLPGQRDGIDVARAAAEAGLPVLFVTGACPTEAQGVAVGCLAKPYTQKQLLSAISAIERKVGGRAPKPVTGLTLFG